MEHPMASAPVKAASTPSLVVTLMPRLSTLPIVPNRDLTPPEAELSARGGPPGVPNKLRDVMSVVLLPHVRVEPMAVLITLGALAVMLAAALAVEPKRKRVAPTYAFFAFVCGSSSFSSSGINRYMDIFILRTAEEFVSERNTTALPAKARQGRQNVAHG